MVPIDRFRHALTVLAVVLVAGACGPEDHWEVPRLPADSLVPEADTAGAEAEEMALADRQEQRRAMEAVDSLFPHSAHRTVGCQRCHQRPRGHATHRQIECVSCHGRPAGFASLPERTAEECAACHHRDVATRSCRACHERDQVGERPVLVAVRAAGADEARVRRLDFDHDDHASRECRACHTTAVTLEYGRECESCHEYHHTQDARCMTCHVEVESPVHSGSVHEGCAGGGCHGNAPVLSLTPTRNVCQVCHQDLVDHRPGQECTECHIGFGDSLRERAPGGGG
ncbi:MAG: hypothetical protein R3314_03165 [Longimicrobiales bacterium]|nr:hypothetical protein [Longimicrobiales bacterium]